MVRTMLLLLVVWNLAGCRPEPKGLQKQDAEASAAAGSAPAPPADSIPRIITTHAFDYSKNFLDALAADEFLKEFEQIRLDGEWFILDSTQRYTFPQYPPLHVTRALFGQDGNRTVKLIVERSNQTTVNYRIEAGIDHELSLVQQGRADIRPTFYLGSESDENDISGNTYFADEYFDDQGDCTTSIRIGKEDPDGPLLGRISKACNGQHISLGLDRSVTLVEKR